MRTAKLTKEQAARLAAVDSFKQHYIYKTMGEDETIAAVLITQHFRKNPNKLFHGKYLLDNIINKNQELLKGMVSFRKLMQFIRENNRGHFSEGYIIANMNGYKYTTDITEIALYHSTIKNRKMSLHKQDLELERLKILQDIKDTNEAKWDRIMEHN